MKNMTRKSKLVAGAALAFALALTPALPAQAAYQDWYSISCSGAKRVTLKTTTNGLTDHLRENVVTHSWNNGASYIARRSSTGISVSLLGVHTFGSISYKWAGCECPSGTCPV